MINIIFPLLLNHVSKSLDSLGPFQTNSRGAVIF